MRTLYIECGMGAAGDMLAAALLELIPNKEDYINGLNNLGIPGIYYSIEKEVKCGITGTHLTVTVNGKEEESHDHRDFNGVSQKNNTFPHEDHEHHHGGHEHHQEDHEHPHEDHEHYHGDHEHHQEDHEHHYEDHEHPHEDHEHHHGGHEHPHEDHKHHHGDHEHHHNNLSDIEHIVRDHLPVSEKVKDDIMAVYKLIAEAESQVHGVPVSEIHFHEVGTMDAVADITAVCMLLDSLEVEEIVVSPVHVGSGQVKCAHGILPVPAPATAYILKDVPMYSGEIRGELCTPTGAALLKHFATRFDSMPVMKVAAIGYGMGKKDFEAANCVRVMMGEKDGSSDEIYELSCNLDDMTGEAIGFAMDRLLEAGALDVYTTAIGMKKSRPGILLNVLCKEKEKERVVFTIFKNTTTIGIRQQKMKRYLLDRRMEQEETSYGTVRCKTSCGYGVERRKYEYEDIKRIAKEKGLSIAEVIEEVKDEVRGKENSGDGTKQ